MSDALIVTECDWCGKTTTETEGDTCAGCRWSEDVARFKEAGE